MLHGSLHRPNPSLSAPAPMILQSFLAQCGASGWPEAILRINGLPISNTTEARVYGIDHVTCTYPLISEILGLVDTIHSFQHSC